MTVSTALVPAGTQPVDGLSLWESESQGNQAALSLIRVDGNERLLIPFTSLMSRAEVHFVDASTVKSYFHCNRADCVLCRAGLWKDTRDLWPVYDLVDQAIGVLAITPNMRAGSLRSQLLPILRKAKDVQERFLLSIRQEKQKFTLSTTPLPDDVEDGAARIDQFVKQLAAGEVDLGSVYPRYSNEELASIAEIATRLAVKGIKAA
jgi:hypothetical protein